MNTDSPSQLPLIYLRPEGADDAARKVMGFRYASPEVGNRHQLGGIPSWIQQEMTPDCPGCSRRMTFYGQLDSIGDTIDIADCGMIYVFLCFDCFHAEAIVQSG